jgi:hypothetical protein
MHYFEMTVDDLVEQGATAWMRGEKNSVTGFALARKVGGVSTVEGALESI